MFLLLLIPAEKAPQPRPMTVAERIEGIPIIWPRPVRTVPYTIQVPEPPPVVAGPAVIQKQVRPAPVKVTGRKVRREKRRKRADICRGKGRVYIRGGKSWRCRR